MLVKGRHDARGRALAAAVPNESRAKWTSGGAGAPAVTGPPSISRAGDSAPFCHSVPSSALFFSCRHKHTVYVLLCLHIRRTLCCRLHFEKSRGTTQIGLVWSQAPCLGAAWCYRETVGVGSCDWQLPREQCSWSRQLPRSHGSISRNGEGALLRRKQSGLLPAAALTVLDCG